jgi:PAS domain S-box-containing protein
VTAVTEERRADNRRLEDQLLQWLAADAGEVLSVVDKTGALSYVTQSSERLFGWPPSELEGRPAEELFHPDDLRLLGGRQRGGERRNGTRMRCRHRDGSWRTIEARVRPILSTPGVGPIGLVVFSRDVTEQSAAHRELRQSALRLAEVEAQLVELQDERDRLIERLGDPRAGAGPSDRLKAEFLQTISHELRTPLTAILGFSDLLASDEALKDRSELEIIRRNGRRLLDIVEDMLTVARAESGDLELNLVATNVATTATRLVENNRRQAEQRNLQIRVEAPPQVVALADELALTSILRHLLANAIKFTARGEIVVRVSESDARVRISVEDSGPGVPARAREAIFHDFTQGDQSLTRRHGGIGVGLSLVRRLVALQDGEFGLDDRPGGGAIFWFSLPQE